MGNFDNNRDKSNLEYVKKLARRHNVASALFADMVLEDRNLFYYHSHQTLEVLFSQHPQHNTPTPVTMLDFLTHTNHRLNQKDNRIPIYWDQSHKPMGRTLTIYDASRIASLQSDASGKKSEMARHAERMVYLRYFYDRIFDLVYNEVRTEEPNAAQLSRNVVTLVDEMATLYPDIVRDEWLMQSGFVQQRAREAIRFTDLHPHNRGGGFRSAF